MKQELIEKARQAASPEEIMKLAEENDVYMVKEEAERIYDQLHASGEVADEELESVAGGGCSGSGGKTIVTSGCECFTGQFKKINSDDAGGIFDLRRNWYDFARRDVPSCGECIHLEFKSGIGYCGVSG